MTDRANYLTVVLDRDYRTDDLQPVIDAILMIKGVTSVDINVSNPEEHMAIQRAKMDLRSKFFDLLK